MNQQPVRVEGSPWRGLSHGSASLGLERTSPAAVVISWSGAAVDGMSSLESSQIELDVADFESATNGWTRRATFKQQGFVDAISASNCAEVVVTASVGDSASAKQAVLELAGLLTRQLERTKPLVRVRFLPRPPQRRRPKQGRR